MASSSTTRATPRRRQAAVNVLGAMASGPWAILPEKLDAMIQVASRKSLPIEAIEKAMGEPLENTYLATVRDGIATIDVSGPLFKRAGWFARICGAASYEDIARDFTAALDNPAVSAIVFNFNSEGGQVVGCSELARIIYEARGQKPVVAYVEGVCASAAFWLASACDRIVAADTALVGSLGCVLGIELTKKQDEMLGIEHIEIVSSQTPGKRIDPSKPAGRAQLQSMVDELAAVFLASVAEYRDVGADAVAEQYGAGRLLVGASAVEAGLADSLGSYEGVVAELLASPLSDGSSSEVLSLPAAASATASRGRPTTTPATETARMKTTQLGGRGAQAGAPAAPTTPPAPADTAPTGAAATDGTPDEGEDNEDEEGEDGKPKAKPAAAPTGASAIAAAVTAERERVLAIQALGRPGEEAIVASCVADPSCTPATAALKLRQAEPAAARNHLAALAGDERNAAAPSAAGGSTEVTAEDMIVNAGKPAQTRPSGAK